jgi:AraC-like DNA-binding protein/ligand-binding sensor protein
MNRCHHHFVEDRIAEKRVSGSNIIKRRELDPLLFKAYEVISAYKQASECAVSLLDKNGYSIRIGDYEDTVFFCGLCKKHYPDAARVWGSGEFPCTSLHYESMKEAHRAGGTYIYMCDLGFIYWVSLIYAGGRMVGALSAGRVLYVERREAVRRLSAMSRGGISDLEALAYLADVPERAYDEVKALAQIMGFCAEQIAQSAEALAPPLIKNRAGARNKEKPSGVYPLDKERLLLAALRRGDYDTGRNILREILNSIVVTNPGNFEFIQMRAIELVVILSREALTSTGERRITLEVNNRYIKRIQEARNMEELTESLYAIIERLGGRIFSFQGVRHASALRKAERYIWERYTGKLSLKEIAEVSGLSASYFSSIFKEEMGENLSSYLNRLRAEKAAVMLTETDLPLSEIARACGFEDQSWFSKIFKTYTGVSPGKYRERGGGVPGPLWEEPPPWKKGQNKPADLQKTTIQ